jgi:hypothetical protein
MQSSNEIERRFQKRSRSATETNGKYVSGYAATFNNVADIGLWLEVIRPGAFKRAISQKQDVKCLVNHDPSQIIGRTKNNTLALTEDSKGLKFRCGPVPNTRVGQDLLTLLSNQTLSECSYAFLVPPGGDRWSIVPDGNGKRRDMRTLIDVDLADVSVVTYPACPNTQADIDDDEAVDPDRNVKAMVAFASSSAPTELRSRIAAAIKHGPIDAEEAALLARARLFLTRCID